MKSKIFDKKEVSIRLIEKQVAKLTMRTFYYPLAPLKTCLDKSGWERRGLDWKKGCNVSISTVGSNYTQRRYPLRGCR